MHYNKTQRFFFHGSCNVIHDTMNVHTMYMCIFNWNVVCACTPWLSYINTSTLYLSLIALHSPISVILSYSVWIDLAKMLFIFSKPYKKYCFNVCFMMMLCIVWTIFLWTYPLLLQSWSLAWWRSMEDHFSCNAIRTGVQSVQVYYHM